MGDLDWLIWAIPAIPVAALIGGIVGLIMWERNLAAPLVPVRSLPPAPEAGMLCPECGRRTQNGLMVSCGLHRWRVWPARNLSKAFRIVLRPAEFVVPGGSLSIIPVEPRMTGERTYSWSYPPGEANSQCCPECGFYWLPGRECCVHEPESGWLEGAASLGWISGISSFRPHFLYPLWQRTKDGHEVLPVVRTRLSLRIKEGWVPGRRCTKCGMMELRGEPRAPGAPAGTVV